MGHPRDCLLHRLGTTDLKIGGDGGSNCRGTDALCGERPHAASFPWKRAITRPSFPVGVGPRPGVGKQLGMSLPAFTVLFPPPTRGRLSRAECHSLACPEEEEPVLSISSSGLNQDSLLTPYPPFPSKCYPPPLKVVFFYFFIFFF